MGIREVSIDEFYICATEITQSQYEMITGKRPSFFKDRADNPVENVSWYEAVQFCNSLSKKSGYDTMYATDSWICTMSGNGFRLPTEAEWEYACRAGSQTPYFWGGLTTIDTISKYAVWSGDNQYSLNSGPSRVATKLSNGFGLYDMCGNVWEWCTDWFSAFPEYNESNPVGPATGMYKVVRGCSWNYYHFSCLKSDLRGINAPESKLPTLGFRVVRKPTSKGHGIF